MPHILPKGTYYDGSPHVAEGSVECSVRPGDDYTLADNWRDNPKNASICWRKKTASEILAEKIKRADDFSDHKEIMLSIIEEVYSSSAEIRTVHETFADFKGAIRDRVASKL